MSREKDLRIVILWIMIPATILVVGILLSGYYNSTSLLNFLLALILTAGYCVGMYHLYARMAAVIRKKYPMLNDIFKRVALMLVFCYVMNAIQMYIMYYMHIKHGLFPTTKFINNPNAATFYVSVASTIITVLNEAAMDWRIWKKSISETEQLKSTYQKTKLLGLKAQMSPHFLFNCFNTLSSLIHEDSAEAEKFLDEMTKVHRYMLKNDEYHLISLREELKAITSYLHLIKVRYGRSIEVYMDIRADKDATFLPILSLQTIVEDIIYSNTISKSEPLRIIIESDRSFLYITNSVNRKLYSDEKLSKEGFENLLKKYTLLSKTEIEVVESDKVRKVSVPLIFEDKNEEF